MVEQRVFEMVENLVECLDDGMDRLSVVEMG